MHDDAKDLEVVVAHQRAVICGVDPDSDRPEDTHRKSRKVMRIVDLPFDIDPVMARATRQRGTLQFVLPRCQNE